MLTWIAGTGENYFEYYDMYRFVQAMAKNTDLPPEFTGSVKPPDVVIQEVGSRVLTYTL